MNSLNELIGLIQKQITDVFHFFLKLRTCGVSGLVWAGILTTAIFILIGHFVKSTSTRQSQNSDPFMKSKQNLHRSVKDDHHILAGDSHPLTFIQSKFKMK